MLIHRQFEEKYGPEYHTGPAYRHPPESMFHGERVHEADCPQELWDRLQRAREELAAAEETIDALFEVSSEKARWL